MRLKVLLFQSKMSYLDSQAQLYMILEMCRAFDRIFKEHLDGG